MKIEDKELLVSKVRWEDYKEHLRNRIREENEKANDSSERSIALTHEENARRMRAELAMITLGRYSEAIGMDNEEIKSYLR